MIQLCAIILPILILFCGFSIDIGMLEYKKLQMQSAADAAALGGELEAERGTNNWANIGIAEAGVNGFTNGSNNTTVAVVEQATAGAYNGRYDAIQATITQTVHTTFMGALNGGTFTLTAQSSALITPCTYLIGTGNIAQYGMYTYTGSLLGNSCPVYATSYVTYGSGQVAVEAFDVSGPPSSSVNAGYMYPSPSYNVPVIADPLSWETSPTFSSCNHTSYSVTTGNVTLNPGTYCKGLNISNATVTLNPGLYIITGGASWTNATISGTGVTLFFTSGGGGGYGQFIISFASVTLSAANDSSNGAIPAILVFADRNWSHSGAEDFQLLSSTISGDGIWYTPGAGIEVWSLGTYAAPHYLGFVADNMFLAGTQLKPANNYSYVVTGNPFRKQGTLIQ